MRRPIAPPPTGTAVLAWLGPSFLWMLSAAGSGEVLFTPRVAAQYGYVLLWALLIAVGFKWFINREVGRYTVVTGAPLLAGFSRLAGRNQWPLWLILVPQVLVAVATLAGLAGAAATALQLLTGGSLAVLTTILLVVTLALTWWGRYQYVEKVATFLAVALALAIITAALVVGPDWARLGQGLVPRLPPEVDYLEVLPWLGFMLSGAAGIIWYSSWLGERGYGAAQDADLQQPRTPNDLAPEDRQRLHGWLRLLTISITLAVVGALLVAVAFLVLGGELLQPRGLVPQEADIASTLAQLLGQVWGQWGYWFMVAAILLTFCGTILSDQDGFGRMFTQGTTLILQHLGVRGAWLSSARLRNLYFGLLLGVAPIALYWWIGNPIRLLQLAGAIEAAHIPVVTFLVLRLNRRHLPTELRPGAVSYWGSALAGLFFLGFAGVYLLQQVGVLG